MTLSPEILVDPSTLSVVCRQPARRALPVPLKVSLLGLLVSWLGLWTVV